MTYKLIFCLAMCLCLNGSFTPIGEGKSSKGINYQVRPDHSYKSVEDEIAYQIAVIEDMSKHEEQLKLSLVVSRDAHNRKVDSLTALIKNTKP